MRTAIDTNVISAIWSGEKSGPQLLQHLNQARLTGGLVICPVVYTELHGYPRITRSRVDDFLAITSITVDWALKRDVWNLAAERYRDYVIRRRQHRDGEPRRLPADYIVGAHAALCADRLITCDKRRYAVDFAEVRLD
ncbi:MAG: type II toxin-antitoxin system VapC family toxin [Acidobacteriaceae bacterium]